MTRKQAALRLTRRWHSEVKSYPLMRRSIPLALYIQVNIGHVMKHNLLKAYDSPEVQS